MKEILADPRRRTIIITVLAALVLLVLMTVLIARLASKKPVIADLSNEEPAVAIEDPFNIADAAASTLDPVANTTESASTPAATTTTTTAPAQTSTSLPKTGPADNLALALLLGAVATFVSSRALAYRKA